MNRWILPCLIANNSVFGLSPDELDAKPDDFSETHSQEEQVHHSIDEFCSNACFMFWECRSYKSVISPGV